MTKKEINKMCAKIREQTKKILKSPKACREFLQSTGVYTKTGRLRKPYRPFTEADRQIEGGLKVIGKEFHSI